MSGRGVRPVCGGYSGRIDDIRLYGAALTPAQVQALYEAGR